jgi:hypothetical protein
MSELELLDLTKEEYCRQPSQSASIFTQLGRFITYFIKVDRRYERFARDKLDYDPSIENKWTWYYVQYKIRKLLSLYYLKNLKKLYLE